MCFDYWSSESRFSKIGCVLFSSFLESITQLFEVDILFSHGAVQAVNPLRSVYSIFWSFWRFVLLITFKFFLLAFSVINISHVKNLFISPE